MMRSSKGSPGTCIPEGVSTFLLRAFTAHHHRALSLMAVWFLITETHRGQQLTPALILPQVRYGLSPLLLEVYCTPGVDDICRQVQRQLLRNELARFYHHRTRKCILPRKLRVGRDRARCLTARFPIPPVRTVRAAFTAHGSREAGITACFPFIDSMESTM